MNVDSPREPAMRKARSFTPLNVVTVVFVVAWLVFACYALAYLISH
jgi:hypothetical protein